MNIQISLGNVKQYKFLSYTHLIDFVSLTVVLNVSLMILIFSLNLQNIVYINLIQMLFLYLTKKDVMINNKLISNNVMYTNFISLSSGMKNL